MHYKGDMVNLSCRQTCGNVPLLAVAFKLGIEWMENIKFWCHITKDCSDTHLSSFFLKHFRCWDERERGRKVFVVMVDLENFGRLVNFVSCPGFSPFFARLSAL